MEDDDKIRIEELRNLSIEELFEIECKKMKEQVKRDLLALLEAYRGRRGGIPFEVFCEWMNVSPDDFKNLPPPTREQLNQIQKVLLEIASDESNEEDHLEAKELLEECLQTEKRLYEKGGH